MHIPTLTEKKASNKKQFPEHIYSVERLPPSISDLMQVIHQFISLNQFCSCLQF